MEYRRYEGETAIEFQYRVSKDKDLIGTWQDVADICNKELGYEYTESKYRKDWASFCKMFGGNQAVLTDSDKRLKDIEDKERELRKQAQRFYDQRREYNKTVVQEARAENLEEHLVEAANDLAEHYPFMPRLCFDGVDDSCEAVVFFADWHYGMVTNNLFNIYNTEICKKRVGEFVCKARDRILLHKPKALHIVCMGDCAHGAIHVSARVRSEEDTCDQLMQASELMAQAIHELSTCVPKTYVYTTYGNHLRTVQHKSESVHADNMERIVGWWLKERFKNCDNIVVVDSEYAEFARLQVCGYTICCVHGDLDNIRQIGTTLNTIFSRQYNSTIDYTVSADKHHIEELDVLGIENTIVPALCGTDDYANEKRLYSNPAQTLMIFNQDGKDATYHIRVH